MSNLDKRLAALEGRLQEAARPVDVMDAARRALERMTTGLGLDQVARSGGLKAWVARYFGADWLSGPHGLDVLALAGPAAWATPSEHADRALDGCLSIFNGLCCAPPRPPEHLAAEQAR